MWSRPLHAPMPAVGAHRRRSRPEASRPTAKTVPNDGPSVEGDRGVRPSMVSVPLLSGQCAAPEQYSMLTRPVAMLSPVDVDVGRARQALTGGPKSGVTRGGGSESSMASWSLTKRECR